MEVSAINAVSPTKIDWRRLTAKEIIKLDTDGIDVPTEYLQWAKEFRQDLSASYNDDITYEKATSGKPASKTEKNEQQNSVTDTENPDSPAENNEDTDNDIDSNQAVYNNNPQADTQNEEVSDNENIQDPAPKKTAAQKKHEVLRENGVSLRTQARIFTQDSKASTKSVLESASLISSTQQASDNEIQALEDYMRELISKAESEQNELKSEVSKINVGKSDNQTFSKIEKLQQQLERYGNNGQSSLAQSQSRFENMNSTINSQSDAIFNSSDFGTETIEIGNQLKRVKSGMFLDFIINQIVGSRATKAGNRAVFASYSTQNLQDTAINKNNTNSAQIPGYQSEVQDKTGVQAAPKNNNTSDGENPEAENETNKTTSETQKPNTANDNTQDNSQASSTPKTTADYLATGDLDKVIQAKIKRGEVLEEY